MTPKKNKIKNKPNQQVRILFRRVLLLKNNSDKAIYEMDLSRSLDKELGLCETILKGWLLPRKTIFSYVVYDIYIIVYIIKG